MTPEVGPDDDALEAVGAALGRLRRRTHLVDVVEPPVDRRDLSWNVVVNIIDEGGGETTVGGVAEQLGIDPSAASRLVSTLISHGYVARSASQQDGRRSVLGLTPDGLRLRDRYRSQHRQAFEHITRSWPPHERRELARLLVKYVDSARTL